MSVLKDLMWFFKSEKKSYFVGIFILLLIGCLQVILPYAVRIIADGIKAGTLTREVLMMWSVIALGIGITTYFLGYIWRVMLFGAANRLGRLLRNRLYQQFSSMSPQFFHKKRTGDLMAHATNDIRAIEMTAGEGVLTLADSIIKGSVVIIAMVILVDWKLTLVALIPMPFMAYATSKLGTVLHKRFHKAQAAFSDTNDKVQENISGVRVIKAFGQEDAEKKDFDHLLDDVVDKNIAVARVDSMFDPVITMVVGLSYFFTLAYGSYGIINGTLTIGELIQFTMYLGFLIWPLLAFGWLFNIVERGRASYDRVNSLLQTKPDIADQSGARDEVPSGDLVYQIEKYVYPKGNVPVLSHVDFKLKRGETLGIVGKTGSGKSTLLRLLLREFDVAEKEILIGGKSIQSFRLESLRKAIGYVPQDHFLFSTTVAENIAFGKPDATQAEIDRVAKLACIHEDILSFESGYETIVGERGVTLSGGQKQRISIARALLLNPEILILDDSLSAVDAKTEHSILDALRKERAGKTTMISAHRLSAVEQATNIIVLNDGKVIEQGSHRELMEQKGWYRMTYDQQQLESVVMEGGGAIGN
ncbi:ATP-binding cassette domain-containing protein [Hazenella sp. IB182357]|uniref:ATP-binding cassette domain-containing protein n=1 Tax=Polycladospora coralii TaxID=2771432 RepID=A0A926N8M7_9BACL|nr:ABC transporter transmembrane domain-containing protein [Polycladospora coralii]MBD1371693.1 ATP-binding cassette domain-containing protein [Polycladospora coralii]MBS7529160.1 ATP-binding cassette domain-containing protein [Polycladospora coralii]